MIATAIIHRPTVIRRARMEVTSMVEVSGSSILDPSQSFRLGPPGRVHDDPLVPVLEDLHPLPLELDLLAAGRFLGGVHRESAGEAILVLLPSCAQEFPPDLR